MFSKYGLKKKLLLAFFAVCLSALVGGVFVIKDLIKIQDLSLKTRALYSSILDVRDVRVQTLFANSIAKDLASEPQSPQLRADAEKQLQVYSDIVANFQLKVGKGDASPTDQQFIELIKSAEIGKEKFRELLNTNSTEPKSWDTPLAKLLKFTEETVNKSNALITEYQKLVDSVGNDFDAAKKEAMLAEGLSTLLTMLLLLAVALPVVLNVSRALTRVREELEVSINDMGRSGQDLSASTSSMASSTTESAAAIQESVSAMTEMSSMISQTVNHTGVASSLSAKLMSKTSDGSSTMQEMDNSMQSISRANTNLREINLIIEEISSKTAVINEIVFKTQLLAVNASIEAARAGVHGKGFAVVAGEVSNLATMSGQAAAQIRELLSQSTKKVTSIVDETGSNVRHGEQVCQKATKLFEEISSSLDEMSEKVQQINDAAREQEIGVKQTTQAIDQLSQATSMNNSVAQENTVMCADLQAQSRKLSRIGKALNHLVTGDENGGAQTNSRNGVDRILNSEIAAVSRHSESESSHESPFSRPSDDNRSSRQLATSLVKRFKGPRAVPSENSESDRFDKSA